jgi:hypothetical protein
METMGSKGINLKIKLENYFLATRKARAQTRKILIV